MDIKETLVKAVDNVKDAFNEGTHRGEAEAERTKRDVAGDQMTPGETVSSYANEAKNNVQAGIDHAKQDARNNT
jgi:hypothetical protein